MTCKRELRGRENERERCWCMPTWKRCGYVSQQRSSDIKKGSSVMKKDKDEVRASCFMFIAQSKCSSETFSHSVFSFCSSHCRFRSCISLLSKPFNTFIAIHPSITILKLTRSDLLSVSVIFLIGQGVPGAVHFAFLVWIQSLRHKKCV